ncbi:hypothetical protein [Actinomadura violacea]|uniref:Uncharacterized protein n=1 Tax=Actinomadura violacea TaxID=2819934 RepID=A0ABS3RXW5_9ACTN|nr:hypothetical protein [Actinomadura violacea]MBO2461599.1 hypothetical protein [Actinomadura violacea]
MSIVDTHPAAQTLAAALARQGVRSRLVPLGLMTDELFIAVSRLSGRFRWVEGGNVRHHEVTDPGGAAARIANCHDRLFVAPGRPAG